MFTYREVVNGVEVYHTGSLIGHIRHIKAVGEEDPTWKLVFTPGICARPLSVNALLGYAIEIARKIEDVQKKHKKEIELRAENASHDDGA